MNKLILHILFICFSAAAFAQNPVVHLSRSTLKIGEEFTLTYSIVSTSPLKNIHYLPQFSSFHAWYSGKTHVQSDSLYQLEMLTPFTDTTFTDSNSYVWKGTYHLTGWDSAFVVIPPDSIALNDSVFHFSPQLVQITSPPVIAGKPIYDIRAHFSATPNHNKFITFIKKNGWWIAVLIVGLLLLFFVIKKRRKKTLSQALPISLLEQVLTKIDSLEKEKGYETDLKEYYFQLSLILRWFLANKYQKEFLERTTKEIEIILQHEKLERDTITTIKKLLMQADMVKFAKSTPPIDEAKEVTNIARKIVQQLSNTTVNG